MARLFDGLVRGACLVDAVARILQQQAKSVAQERVVFDQQDGGCCRSYHSTKLDVCSVPGNRHIVQSFFQQLSPQ